MAVPPEISPPDDDPDSRSTERRAAESRTPYEELAALRSYGPVQYDWLIDQIIQVARINGFPPPTGSLWTEELAADWLHEQLAGPRGVEFIVGAYMKVTDDKSYRLYARRSIKNALIDEAVATPVGRLRKRLRGLLAKEKDFVDATEAYGGTHAWTLDGVEGIWQGDSVDLLRAPGLLELGTIQKLNPAGPTSADNKAKLVGAARAIIQHAGGALSAQVLASAIVRLFDLEDLPDFGFDDLEVEPARQDDHESVEDAIDRERGWARPNEYLAPVDWLSDQDDATAVLEGFTREEMIAVGLADHPVETLAEVLGMITDPGAFQKLALTKFVGRCSALNVSAEARAIAASRCQAAADD